MTVLIAEVATALGYDIDNKEDEPEESDTEAGK